MAAMAVSVTLIFFNSLRGRPRIFFDAILSVGRVPRRPKSSDAALERCSREADESPADSPDPESSILGQHDSAPNTHALVRPCYPPKHRSIGAGRQAGARGATGFRPCS